MSSHLAHDENEILDGLVLDFVDRMLGFGSTDFLFVALSFGDHSLFELLEVVRAEIIQIRSNISYVS